MKVAYTNHVNGQVVIIDSKYLLMVQVCQSKYFDWCNINYR